VNEKFLEALARAAVVFADARGRRDTFMPNKRRLDVTDMAADPGITPKAPDRMICRACDVVSTDPTCWMCGDVMDDIENQRAGLARVAGCVSDEPDPYRRVSTPAEPRGTVFP
jgi:hypothetical protein